MSESNPSVVYTVDELFLADCTPSKFDVDDSASLYSASFMDRSHKNNSNCGILAFYMLKFLIGRLMYNKTRYLKQLKFRALVRWRYFVPVVEEFHVNEVVVQKFLKVVLKYFKCIIKKRLMKWVEFTRFSAFSAKFLRRKIRRGEAHNGQVRQTKRVIAQIQMKKSETEREFESSLCNERKLKESQEKPSKLKSASDSKKSRESLKKLMQENDDLKNTLEALSNNVSILLKEMGGVLGFDEQVLEQENGLEDSGLRTSRRKKLSGLRP